MFQLSGLRVRDSRPRHQHERGGQPRGRHHRSISPLRACQDTNQQVEIRDFCMEILLLIFFSDDLDNDIDDIIQDFEGNCEREVLHTVLFY